MWVKEKKVCLQKPQGIIIYVNYVVKKIPIIYATPIPHRNFIHETDSSLCKSQRLPNKNTNIIQFFWETVQDILRLLWKVLFPDFLFSPFMYKKHHLCIDRQLTLCVKFVSYTLLNMFIALEETWLNYWCSLCIKPNKWIEILWLFLVLFHLSFSSCRCLVQLPYYSNWDFKY